jgi:hypothetical protein
MQMTDEQVLTAAIAIVVPISALIYSNSRINEAKETLRAEMQIMKSEILTEFQSLKAEVQALRAEVRAALAEMKTGVRIHELEHHK